MYDMLVLNMYNTAYRILGNKEDTQDCLQNGFTLIFTKIHKYDPDKGTIWSWAKRIVINECLGMLRKKKIKFQELPESLSIIDEDVSMLEMMEAEYLFQLINELPYQLRIIFNLYEIEGYAHKEIAEKLEIVESSSRTYLTRAKAKLKSKIKMYLSTDQAIVKPRYKKM